MHTWKNRFCVLPANSEYTKASDQGACCVSSNQQHEGCMVHSSFATVSEDICRAACDNDAHCKGYAIRDANGGMFCRLATTVFQCPHNWNTISGSNGALDSSASCETDYDGCYIKDNCKLTFILSLDSMFLNFKFCFGQKVINDICFIILVNNLKHLQRNTLDYIFIFYSEYVILNLHYNRQFL